MGLLLFPCRVIENKIAFKKLVVHLCDLELVSVFLDMILQLNIKKQPYWNGQMI